MRKTAYLGLLTSIAIILGYIEMLIPVFAGIPGIKLGLANLIMVFVLYTYSWKEAMLVSCVRVVVIGFLFGNLFSILFSLAGGAASLLIMNLVKKISGFSQIGVSIAGGVMHNMAQIAVAVLVVENVKLFYYLPVLLVAGVITGLLIGIVSRELLLRLDAAMEKERQGRNRGDL